MILVASALVVTGGTLWFARMPLADLAVAHVLARTGLGPADVRFSVLGPTHAEFAVIRSGLGAIARIDLRYALAHDGWPDLRAVTLEGVRIAIDAARWPPLGTGTRTGGVPLRRMPEIAVRDARVTWKSATGTVAAHAHGTLTPGTRAEEFTAKLDILELARDGQPLGAGELTASWYADHRLRITLDSAALRADVTVETGRVTHGLPFALTGTADAALLGALTGAFRPSRGEIAFAAHGAAPPRPTLAELARLDVSTWLRKGRADANVRIDVHELRVPDRVFVGHVHAECALRLAEGVATVHALAPLVLDDVTTDTSGSTAARRLHARLDAHGDRPLLAFAAPAAPEIELVAAIGIDTPHGVARGTVQGRAVFEAPFESIIDTREGGANVTVRADLALTQSAARRVSGLQVAVDGALRGDDDALHFGATSGHVTLTDARWDGMRLAEPLQLSLRPDTAVTWTHGAGALAARATFAPWHTRVRLARGETASDVSIAAEHLGLQLDTRGTSLALRGGALALPGHALALEGVRGTWRYVAGQSTLALRIPRVRSTASPALFVPLAATLDARLTGVRVAFAADLRDASGRLHVTARGRHQLDSDRGEATWQLAPVAFGNGASVASLSPALAARIDASAGSLTADGTFAWGSRAPPPTLALTLREIALATADLRIRGLDGALRFSNLQPLRAPPGQALRAVLDVPGLGAVPLEARFEVAPARVQFDDVIARILGGELRARGAKFDLDARAGEAEIMIHRLDLEAASKVLDLAEFQGTGRLDGRLPLRIADGRIAVAGAHLEAAAPGVVRIGAAALTEKLAAYGEDVDLAARALADFHYTRLVIDADKPFAGTGRAKVRLEGHNPAVLDSQPFVFNINLETDFDVLAQVLRELAGATQEALGWGVRAGATR